MKNFLVKLLAIIFLFSFCNKPSDNNFPINTSDSKTNGFTQYIIRQGTHYVANNNYKPIELSELKFVVQFDSSSIYRTNDPVNQYDINKLYGFSDNNGMHHDYSARIGWSWNENALRLYAYVYNKGLVEKKELGSVQIGSPNLCSIIVEQGSYIFTVNDHQTIISRSSTTMKAKGYMLYPYFGGDETAPHDIRIYIKNL